jgi:hypothetical protein
MTESRDKNLDPLLREWPYQPGVITARLLQAEDGRQLLQMRIEMGIMQMEAVDRPDGDHPSGEKTYLDYMRRCAVENASHFLMSTEQSAEMDREFLQFYHRRICWLALREFDRAVLDADHTIALMDFVSAHTNDRQWSLSHEQYRPFVLFHRTQAAALGRLENDGAEAAIEEIATGLKTIRRVFQGIHAEEQFENDDLVRQLIELQGWVREQYQIGRTLGEQLADAIASEQYELAARLRDEILRRQTEVS